MTAAPVFHRTESGLCTHRSSQDGPEVYVRAFPSGRSLQVSVDGGDTPHWSADGSELYFFARDGNYMASSFHANGGAPQPGKPVTLFHSPTSMLWFAPSHKAGRFIGAVRTAPEESIKVINYLSGVDGEAEGVAVASAPSRYARRDEA